MKPFHLPLICIALLASMAVSAQDFQNNDLEGVAAPSVAPPFWDMVPHTDPVCLATASFGASPDLCDLEGPTGAAGIMGNPYSGNTFVSGLRSASTTSFWHEGIQQEVDGLTPGQTYGIGFYQTVVKQSFFLDSTGGWAVYMDTTLIGVSEMTISQEPVISTNMPWEYRSVLFTATAASHVFKFLPADDDDDDTSDYGKLRMGIDSIYMYPAHTMAIGEDALVIHGVHPVPNDGRFTVSHGSGGIPDAIEVMDLRGRVVHMERPVMAERTVIDASFLNNGIYFVYLTSAGMRSAAVKLVVDR
jgi:hypothetical protein